MSRIRGHPLLALLGALVLIAVLVPVVAYGVVPLFVRSTLHEAAPAAAATSVSVSSVSASPAAAVPTVLASGGLRRISPVHYGSGSVQLLQVGEQHFLRFQDVDIAAAPDMFVYLSDANDGSPGKYRDLGRLKATSGSFNYEVPGDVELDGIRSVVVWCRTFVVTITFATLARG